MIEIKLIFLLISSCALIQIGIEAYVGLDSKLPQEYSVSDKRHHSTRHKIKHLTNENATNSSIYSNNNTDEDSRFTDTDNAEQMINNSSSSNSSTNSDNNPSAEIESNGEHKIEQLGKQELSSNSSSDKPDKNPDPNVIGDEEYQMDSPQSTQKRDSTSRNVRLGDGCNSSYVCSGDFVKCLQSVCKCQESYIQQSHSNSCEEFKFVVQLRGDCNRTHGCIGEYVECHDGTCSCAKGYTVSALERHICREREQIHLDTPKTDPTMIGIIVGLALMSVTICVVMRLFAKARFRENRTIFNTANPRLMNVSLKKGKKQMTRANSQAHRGSQDSVMTEGNRQNSKHEMNDQSYNVNRPENMILSTSIDEEPGSSIARNGKTGN